MSKHNRRVSTLYRLAKDRPSVANARIVAALYIKNDLISIGFNQLKTDPMQEQYKPRPDATFLHAEIHAIKQALNQMSEEDLINARTTLYVVRAKMSGSGGTFINGLACPCQGCQRAIAKYNIKKVIYTLDDEGTSEL